MLENFNIWNKLKSYIHKDKHRIHFRQGEIWFIHIGQNIGYEIFGKSEKFLRPVFVFRKLNKDFFLGIPLTSKLKNNKFYFEIDLKNKKSALVLSQIRTFDSKRLSYKTGNINKKVFEKIENKFLEVFKLTPKNGEATFSKN